MKRLGWLVLGGLVGYVAGRVNGLTDCEHVVKPFLPPDTSVSRLLHPSARQTLERAGAWN